MVTLPARRLFREEVLRFPLPDHGRLALVDAYFRAGPRMRRFAVEDLRGLADFAPASLVVSPGVGLTLAERKLRGSLELPSLNIAIVVAASSLLMDRDRDLLWKAFGLPVFEQLLGPDGRVVARECEVHEGLHVEEASVREIPEFLAEVTRDICNCGRETPRLLAIARQRRRAAAA